MLDLIFSVFAGIVREYRFRRFLKKQVRMTLPGGEIVCTKSIIRFADLAEKQAKLRQIYGLASNGGQCVVDFDQKKGNATVVPRPENLR